jgi:hypothetical protein
MRMDGYAAIHGKPIGVVRVLGSVDPELEYSVK